MTSKIKVNNIEDTSGNALVTKCGSTLTIGKSGDTISLASGASQTGFGRSGSVNWQTTIKTGNFSAVNGEGYFINTTSGGVTVTLPSSPSAGDIIAIKDYLSTFSSNAVTINRNGEPINGGADVNPTLNIAGTSVVLVYADSTQGWLAVNDDTSSLSGASFLTATGGTITTCGNDKIHTFNTPGTFTVCSVSVTAANNEVSYLVVAGGAAGGFDDGGGGGGAGGFRESKSPVTSYTASPLDGRPSAPNRITVTATGFPITVGAGGASQTTSGPPAQGNPGTNSVFSTITSAAGGGGGSRPNNPGGIAGGSGGGGGGKGPPQSPGGAGNTPPVTPAQGFPGGEGNSDEVNQSLGGGGGGATAAGENRTVIQPAGGAGGAGATTSITGSAVAYAGGGGGGGHSTPSPAGGACGGAGGTGGGGQGAGKGNTDGGDAGSANTGGGGGGGSQINPSGGSTNSGAGGSGVVIIRYRFR